MANARELLKRKKSAQNTRKITRTMELVASAKMKKAQDAAEAARPYADGLADLVARLSSGDGEAAHPLMRRGEIRKVTILVCTSDRGLCGAFNANLTKRAHDRIKEHQAAGREVEVITLGKKANSSLSFLGIEVAEAHSGIMDRPGYAQARAVIEPIMDRFVDHEIDAVEVVYSRFETVARQYPEVVSILPAGGERGESEGGSEDFLYHPDPESILAELIPQTVKTAFFACLLQTSAGEHAARRVAMKNATDAAGDLIKALNSRYNRARQTKITQEIAEIVGAVEAMK